MVNMLTLSMVCFPYVMMGLGQVIVVGINQAERKADNTDEIRGRRITRRFFEKADFSVQDRTIWGYPVLSPHWGTA